MRVIDHLVYAVPNLADGVAEVAQRLGVTPTVGGRHPSFGTHNALVALAGGGYLEILAPDPTNHTAPRPRWMGVDVLSAPRLTRWAVGSSDLTADAARLAAYEPELGRVVDGARQRPDGAWLRWRLTVPRPLPEVEVVPFCIDWSGSAALPTDGLPAPQLRLTALRLTHPDPAAVRPVVEALGLAVTVTTGPARIAATLVGPVGTLTLD